MKIFKTRTRVRFAETDMSGIVYYANYFIYFELGRVALFRELGLPYDRRVPIAETHCNFRASANFGDLLEIRSFVSQLRRAGFRIACEIHRIDESADEAPTLLAEGYTGMVTVGEDHRPIPLPDHFRAALTPCLE